MRVRCTKAAATAMFFWWASAAGASEQRFCSPRADDGDLRRESVLGIVPFLPPEQLELTFGHMAARFSEALDCDVHFRTAATWSAYSANVLAGEYDFALAPPFLFVQLDSKTHFPLGRPPGMASGEFVTVAGSAIENLSDLRGKTVATGPAGSDIEILARYTLVKNGIDPDEDLQVRPVEGTLSCLQQLLAGTVDVCVTIRFARENFAASMGVALNVIAETTSVPRGPMVVHRRVPERDRETVRKLLMSWADNPDNHLPVPGAQVPSLIPVDASEYGVVLEILQTLRERDRSCR